MSNAEPYGFILVTTDPKIGFRLKGSAYDLVKARLATSKWPLYSNTKNRARLVEGARVAFYVGGERLNGGKIVATAVVSGLTPFAGRIDPPEFLTDDANFVLDLEQVHWLEPKIDFKSKVTQLSFCPKNTRSWGSVLMGGARALKEEDWGIVFSVEHEQLR